MSAIRSIFGVGFVAFLFLVTALFPGLLAALLLANGALDRAAETR